MHVLPVFFCFCPKTCITYELMYNILKSTVNAAVYYKILEHFMCPSPDKLCGDADLIFQKDLVAAQQ